MQDKLRKIQSDYSNKIGAAANLKELDQIFLELFGKNGAITLFPKEFPSLPKEELKVIAPKFSQVKSELEKVISDKRNEIREAGYSKLADEKLDLTAIKTPKQKGYLSTVTVFEKEIADIFGKLGFQQFDAPHIDSDYYNFESLNLGPQHPARDLWDTLYIANADKYGFKPGELLLRTHTSNSQVRIMEKYKPPFRMMNIGSCFRYENLDPRHEHTFDQFELIYVDKGLSMANLQYLSEFFLKEIFGPEIKVRMKPKYYPFTEPSAGFEGLCIFCKGKGCKICGTGWLELGGAGMIHPDVLRHGGIDPDEFSGIAWGLGPERMVMLKTGIDDVRTFRSGDLKKLVEASKKYNESQY